MFRHNFCSYIASAIILFTRWVDPLSSVHIINKNVEKLGKDNFTVKIERQTKKTIKINDAIIKLLRLHILRHHFLNSELTLANKNMNYIRFSLIFQQFS